MMKLLTFLKRREPLTRDGFKQRWMGVHAPMALRFPGLRGYMLSFSVDAREPLADGVAQLWFDSRQAVQDSYASDIGREGSGDANAHLTRREQMLASETWVRSEAGLRHLPFKYLLGVKRAAGVSRADFVAWWSDGFAQAVAARVGSGNVRICYDEAGQLLSSGTEGVLALRPGEAPFDGLCEVWFPDRDGLTAFARAEPLAGLVGDRAGWSETFALEEFVMLTPPPPAYGKE